MYVEVAGKHQGGRWLDRYQELINLLIPHLSVLWMYADVVLTDRHAVQVVPWRPQCIV
jgi:hypothetical protein